MINSIIDEVKDKNILVLGLGKEGISTVKFFQKHLPEKVINVSDSKMVHIMEKLDFDKSKINIDWEEVTTEMLSKYDAIFKTPGISFKNINSLKLENKITSQIDMFLKYFKGKSVGVTGTKGKSTTVSLIYEIVNKSINNSVLVGNIGIPVFDKIEDINEETIVIMEISSHQLEFVKNSPYISVLLNIFEEHLDHYNSYEDYINSKLKIFCNNKETKVAIFNKDLEEKVAKFNIEKNIAVDFNFLEKNSRYVYFDNELYYNFTDKSELLGSHNKYNILIALEVINTLGIRDISVAKTINEFKGLPNRLEKVGTYKGITFYNDSISTIPETTISCIETLENLTTLIIGGFDRGVDYTSLVNKINLTETINTIICLPTTGHKIADTLNKRASLMILKVENLEEAVKLAYKNTKEGKTCVMSPAAASYNQFVNFEQRGLAYKQYIAMYGNQK